MKPEMIKIDATTFRAADVVAVTGTYAVVDAISHAFDVLLAGGHTLTFQRTRHNSAMQLRENLLCLLDRTSTAVTDEKPKGIYG